MTIPEFVSTLRAKPEPVRRRIALGTASAVTGVVAFAWVATLAATGAFSLAPASTQAGVLAQASPTVGAAQGTGTNFSELLGAVTASFTGSASTSELVITDNGAKSTLDRTQSAPGATVIPF